MSKKVILIGPCGGGSVPKNGASAKNNQLVIFLRKKNINIQIIDTENWRKNPLVLVALALTILRYPKAKYIIATDNSSGYKIIRLFAMLPFKFSVVYWVIGGSIASSIIQGEYDVIPYRQLDCILVEGEKLKRQFESLNVNNVIIVPNFKNIEYYPSLNYSIGSKVKFVFLSRMIPYKGCDIIINAITLLNSDCLEKFSVSFYGPFEDSYEEVFMSKVKHMPNVKYCGFLDLTQKESYDKLAEYDVMLFPTFWPGEGFPGIFIDAFICGVPVVATDWSINSEIIVDGETGWLIKPKSVESLYYVMKKIIEDPSDIIRMKSICASKAKNFDASAVVNDKLMNTIGIQY